MNYDWQWLIAVSSDVSWMYGSLTTTLSTNKRVLTNHLKIMISSGGANHFGMILSGWCATMIAWLIFLFWLLLAKLYPASLGSDSRGTCDSRLHQYFGWWFASSSVLYTEVRRKENLTSIQYVCMHIYIHVCNLFICVHLYNNVITTIDTWHMCVYNYIYIYLCMLFSFVGKHTCLFWTILTDQRGFTV